MKVGPGEAGASSLAANVGSLAAELVLDLGVGDVAKA